MIRTIYLLRHGSTDSRDLANDIEQTDCPLSTWGVTETNLLRKWYDNGHTYPVYTSPALCCRQSAEIIGGYREKKALLSFVKEDVLMPITVSDGLSDRRKTESSETAGKRLMKALLSIVSWEEKACIVVSHENMIQAFLREILHLSPGHRALVSYPHLGITELRYDGSTFHLADANIIGGRPIEMLRQEEIAHFYSVLKTPPERIRHMQAVSLYMDNILAMLSKDLESYDAELLRAASLTYLADPKDLDGHKHSASFLRLNGYSAVAVLVDGLDSITVTDTLTLSELLYYGDHSILNGQLVSPEERFPQRESGHCHGYEKLKMVQKKLLDSA